MKMDGIDRVGIVGAGTMGGEIAFVCALAGYDTLLYDLERTSIDRTLARLQHTTSMLVASGALADEARRDAFARMEGSTDMGAVARCDLLSESVFEEIAVKREVWKRLGEAAPEATLFTTNTSTLAPSAYADATGRPERFAAMHFHLPILSNRIVDVMTHGGTSAETMDRVEAFVRSLDLAPVRIEKESPAYIYNAMLLGFMREALLLLVDEVATKEQIDSVWTTIMGTGAGPFTIIDYVGVDTVWRIVRESAEREGNAQLARAAEILGAMVERGELGMKSGKGFYAYPGAEVA